MTVTALYFVFPGNLDTPSGGYHYDRRMIQELQKCGLQIQCISLAESFPNPDHQALDDARQKLAALPDGAVVILDGLAFGVMDSLARAEQQRLRLIALCHHPLAFESGLDERQRQAFHTSERSALHSARAVIVTSEATRQILIEHFAIQPNNILVALPGTDPVPFAPCIGVPPRLLTVASLIQRKGHDVLINALAPLTSLPWQARFVGSAAFDPTWAASLQAQIVHQQLQQRIQFTGAVADLQTEYQSADLFVLASRFEGYGMVFAEALAAGLPIVATGAGAATEVIPDSAGILVPTDDSEALNAALYSLLSGDELRQRLQAGARAAAATLPLWQDSAQQVAQLINKVRES